MVIVLIWVLRDEALLQSKARSALNETAIFFYCDEEDTMWKGLKYALLVACLSGLSIAYATPETNNEANASPPANPAGNRAQNVFSDPATTIYVRKEAPEFKLRLESNPSAGYSWFLKKCDTRLVNVTHHKLYPSRSQQQAGAPGYEEWVFKATPAAFMAPHITHVILVYARPSEVAHSQDQKKFTVVTK
jgi:predicted secreted protein